MSEAKAAFNVDIPTSTTLFVSTRSSRAPLLVGSCITWVWKLSSVLFRKLWGSHMSCRFFFCQQIQMGIKDPHRPGLANTRPLLDGCRRPVLFVLPGETPYSTHYYIMKIICFQLQPQALSGLTTHAKGNLHAFQLLSDIKGNSSSLFSQPVPTYRACVSPLLHSSCVKHPITSP